MIILFILKVRGTDPLLPYLFGGEAPLLAVVEKVTHHITHYYSAYSYLLSPYDS